MSPAASGLAVRITLPFSDLSGTVRAWALKADKLLCYEHIGEETSKPHCHLLMIGVICNKERLKQIAKECGLKGGGNEFWSFKTAKQEAERYIVYMSKGKFDPLYNKGYEPDFLQTCKDAWEQGEAEPNRDQKLCKEFEDIVYTFVRDLVEKCQPPWYDGWFILRDTDLLKQQARSWAFKRNKLVWSGKTGSEAKLVFLTYCMRYDLVIPSDVKVW